MGSKEMEPYLVQWKQWAQNGLFKGHIMFIPPAMKNKVRP
jgi:hypothetical protein